MTLTGWFWVHISLIASGFIAFMISVLSAAIYLLQSAQLKSKQFGKNFLRLPSLESLDRIHFKSLSWGVALFSLGILSGIFWARDIKELPALFRDPKVILSFLTCVMYWVVLSVRLSALRRGQKIAVGTSVIFVLLIITFMTRHYTPALAAAQGF